MLNKEKIAEGLPDCSGNTFVRNEQKIAAKSRILAELILKFTAPNNSL
jgi:hypothetical protein